MVSANTDIPQGAAAMPPRHAWPVVPAANGYRQPSYQAYTARNLRQIPQLRGQSDEQLLAMRAVAAVLPFRTNSYVVDQLIDWDDLEHDPIYRLTFPSPGMLRPDELARMVKLLRDDASPAVIAAEARDIRRRLNPHPSGQLVLNVPEAGGHPLGGLQHKYHETVLFFPSPGQMCHAFCTYCFRWAQFVGEPDLKLSCNDPEVLCGYLRRHPEATDVLITGGDPMVMRTDVLARFVAPLLAIDSVRTVRIGTKAVAYWPYRFLSDSDADALSRLFERVVHSGRQLAIMAHYSHPRELAPDPAREAVRRIRATGASVYVQGPLIRGINDRPELWVELWRTALDLGAIPYYMFVERDTGPREYFEVPLAECWSIFRAAYSQISGLGRTVRGPVMSATPGKVALDGITEIGGTDVFQLHYLQARDPELVGRPFFAKFDAEATWFDQLSPAFDGHRQFFDPTGQPTAR
jgi:L-lysine 2,3-aminomutase